jgi:hypothetical protein
MFSTFASIPDAEVSLTPPAGDREFLSDSAINHSGGPNHTSDINIEENTDASGYEAHVARDYADMRFTPAQERFARCFLVDYAIALHWGRLLWFRMTF